MRDKRTRRSCGCYLVGLLTGYDSFHEPQTHSLALSVSLSRVYVLPSRCRHSLPCHSLEKWTLHPTSNNPFPAGLGRAFPLTPHSQALRVVGCTSTSTSRRCSLSRCGQPCGQPAGAKDGSGRRGTDKGRRGERDASSGLDGHPRTRRCSRCVLVCASMAPLSVRTVSGSGCRLTPPGWGGTNSLGIVLAFLAAVRRTAPYTPLLACVCITFPVRPKTDRPAAHSRLLILDRRGMAVYGACSQQCSAVGNPTCAHVHGGGTVKLWQSRNHAAAAHAARDGTVGHTDEGVLPIRTTDVMADEKATRITIVYRAGT